MVSIQLGSAALICFIVVLKHGQISAKDVDTHQNRTGKFLSLFSLIQFPNDACPGSDGRNGSCFTQGECDQRVIKMCGQTVNTECSYLVQTRLTPVPSDCSYTICKSNPNICRIRLDFQSFDIAGPTSDMIADATGLTSIGDCLSDSFSFTAPGGLGSPIICGFNTGQHMILDASDSCNVASFNIDPVGTTAREWDIKVTQFDCADEAGAALQPYIVTFKTDEGETDDERMAAPTTGSVGFSLKYVYEQC
eukprot:TCALIF_11518-PA protein Name:"Protein of unknown function" AED:0.17 eAED:0.17 QI:15/0.71/1/1/0.57/0.75/8/59/249